jgi:hypothetical protein
MGVAGLVLRCKGSSDVKTIVPKEDGCLPSLARICGEAVADGSAADNCPRSHRSLGRSTKA